MSTSTRRASQQPSRGHSMWVRSEVFTHSVTVRVDEGVDKRSAHAAVATLRSLNTTTVSLDDWVMTAKNSFGMSETQASAFFDSFLALSPLPLPPNSPCAPLSTFGLYLFSSLLFIHRSPATTKSFEISHPDRDMRTGGKTQQAPHEAHTAFVRSILADLVLLVCSTSSPSCLQITRDEFDLLSFVMCGAIDGNATAHLSAVCPLFDTQASVPITDVVAFLADSLQTNEIEYPSLRSMLKEVTADSPLMSPERNNAVYVGMQKQTAAMVSAKRGSEAKLTLAHNKYSFVYALASFATASVTRCKNTTVVIGAVSRSLVISGCEGVRVIACARRVEIRDCVDVEVHVLTHCPIVFSGDCHCVLVGPFNTTYGLLGSHLEQAGLSPEPERNTWEDCTELSRAGDLSSSFTSYGNSPPQPYSFVAPSDVQAFVVPFEMEGPTTTIPGMPDEFLLALEAQAAAGRAIRSFIAEADLSEKESGELSKTIQGNFEEWAVSQNGMREVKQLVACAKTAEAAIAANLSGESSSSM